VPIPGLAVRLSSLWAEPVRMLSSMTLQHRRTLPELSTRSDKADSEPWPLQRTSRTKPSCRTAERCALSRDDSGSVGRRHERKFARGLPVLACGVARVSPARCASRRLGGGGQDHFHQLGSRSHPLGRTRELRGVQGKALHRRSRSVVSRSTALLPKPFAPRSTPARGRRQMPTPR
jgi:hypothetical protein